MTEFRVFVEPLTDHPLQLLEPLLMRDAARVFFANAGIQPLASLLHEKNRVIAKGRGLSTTRFDARLTFLLGDVWAKKAERGSCDLNGGPLRSAKIAA